MRQMGSGPDRLIRCSQGTGDARHREQSWFEVEHEWGMIGWLLGVMPGGALIGVNPD
jgi:hypothetical protein